MSDLSADLQAGLSDRYTIDRELGRGGMATVYLARDLRHDRMVALKVVHSTVEGRGLENRFQHEIRISARLTHPHILTVFDSGETAGHLWFTMPYVEGESLRDRLNGIGRLPVNQAVRIAREATQALSYAHRHNVIHRDIKPENILLTDEGSTLVADFGIARAIQHITSTGGTKQSPITEVGAVIGTPAYMSPEQRVGVSVDVRSDIYSLAVVLVEMLTGDTPSATRGLNALQAIKADSSIQVRKQRPEISAGLEKVIAKALAIDPGKRYATMEEFAEALEEFDSVPKRRKPIAARYAAFAAGVAVLALVIVYGMTRHDSRAPSKDKPLRIAVLPFTNQGDSSNAYFADGVTDAVRGKLSAVPGLQVIASNSSSQYAGSSKTATQIGEELGVQYLVTGKVRWSGTGKDSRVQVSPELVDVSTGSVKWQAPFDKALTDVFQVQADIAGQVASALDVALDAGERAQLAAKPTENLEAYDLFLKARAATANGSRNDPAAQRAAIPLLRRAIDLDPRFDEAYAALAGAHSSLFANTAPDSAIGHAAKIEADSAVALAPKKPSSFVALGTYYSLVQRDQVRFIENLTIARQLGTPSGASLSQLANAEFALGRTADAVNHAHEALRLDPRSPLVLNRAARIFSWLRKFDEADSLNVQQIALTPEDPGVRQRRVKIRLAFGDLAGARQLMDATSPTIPRPVFLAYMTSYYDLYWVLLPPAQDSVLKMSHADFDGDVGTYGLVKAEILAARGDRRTAAVYADTSRRDFEAQIRAAPQDPQLRALLAMALTITGQLDQAVVEAERAGAEVPLPLDPINSSYVWELVARVYVSAGQVDKAVDALEQLLKAPGELTPARLRIDPYFAPLKGNPRFENLIAGK